MCVCVCVRACMRVCVQMHMCIHMCVYMRASVVSRVSQMWRPNGGDQMVGTKLSHPLSDHATM